MGFSKRNFVGFLGLVRKFYGFFKKKLCLGQILEKVFYVTLIWFSFCRNNFQYCQRYDISVFLMIVTQLLLSSFVERQKLSSHQKKQNNDRFNHFTQLKKSINF